jgi:hypothetical protein
MTWLVVATNDYDPRFGQGDVIGGNKISGPGLHNHVGRECIVELADGSRRIMILLATPRPGVYDLRSLRPSKTNDLKGQKLKWAAPIQVILRGQ